MSYYMDSSVRNKYNLMQVCNWKNLKNVAIEHYYSMDNSFFITYHNIRKIQRLLKIFLNNIKIPSSQFIGISSDIPIFCIPTLILSIISSGHAFVYLSKESQNLMLKDTYLNIQYIFFPKNTHEINKGRVIKRFIMHKQSLILVKVAKIKSQCKQQIDLQNSISTNCFAYAVTTSGSTGHPSIIRVTHASITLNILDLRKIFKLKSTDKVVHLTPLTFDPSIIEIFLSISSGASLLTVSDNLKNNPHELLTLLNKKCATFLSSTPSLLLHRWSLSNLRSTILGKNSSLRILLLGGEQFPSPLTILQMKDVENRTRIFNIYGITEVSCWASINEICFDNNDDNNDLIMKHNSLGTTLSETVFQVRSEDDNKIINDGEGFLYIGSNIRICAINNENICNLTPPIFRNTGDLVIINKSGEIKFNGRQDSCVKRFGIKVYLNELEYHVKQLSFIKDCHTIFIQQPSALHLFYTVINNNEQLSNDNENKLIDNLWNHVRKLSTIIRPDYIHYLEQFEINEHGKICKDNLRKLSSIKVYNNDVGKLFESIWKNHLPVINDYESSRFVDTGGTSIIALEILSKLTNNFDSDFPQLIGMLLENSTLSECQSYVVNQHRKIKSLSMKSTCYHEYNNTRKTIVSHKFPDKNNICQWQKCRGKTTKFHLDPLIKQSSSSSSSFLHDHCSVDDEYIMHNLSKPIKLLHLHDLTKCVDASPTVFKYISDDEIYVSVGSHSGIICTIKISNNHIWKVKLPGRIEASILIIDSFKGIVGCHDGFIYCFHLMTGEIHWKYETHNIVKCMAVMCSYKQNIFIGSYDRFIYCISIETGALIWKQHAASTCATPLVHEDTCSVIFASLDGNCISMNQTDGKIRWKHQLASPIFSSPTLINDNKIAIIADVNGNIVALEIHSGNELWNIKISEYIFSDLATIHKQMHYQFDSFIIATKKGNIYKYDFKDENFNCPTLVYKINCELPIFASPWVDNKFILVAQENGELKIFLTKTGILCSSMRLGGECFSSPILHENLIFVGCRDNNLYILIK